MNGQMKGFVNGVLFSLVGKPLPVVPVDEPTAYNYNASTQTLTVNEDDGSLSFGWDWDTMKMEVEANGASGNNLL